LAEGVNDVGFETRIRRAFFAVRRFCGRGVELNLLAHVEMIKKYKNLTPPPKHKGKDEGATRLMIEMVIADCRRLITMFHEGMKI